MFHNAITKYLKTFYVFLSGIDTNIDNKVCLKV